MTTTSTTLTMKLCFASCKVCKIFSKDKKYICVWRRGNQSQSPFKTLISVNKFSCSSSLPISYSFFEQLRQSSFLPLNADWTLTYFVFFYYSNKLPLGFHGNWSDLDSLKLAVSKYTLIANWRNLRETNYKIFTNFNVYFLSFSYF